MGVPEGFVSEFDGLVEALSQEPSVSVRCNVTKGVAVPDGADMVPWCDSGFYLDSRLPFTFDPAMHQGLYYVQDASSMIYSHIIRTLTAGASEPLVYLDACAAPGGKTTAAIDALPADSLIVANEYVFNRAEVLKENLIKWGSRSVVVTRGDTARFSPFKETFDIIAIDAPCSGEGMFRKDEEAVRQWSPSLVKECACRQREIIGNLWKSLKPGGYLIYSTCTFNREENEDIVNHILEEFEDASAVNLEFPADFNLVSRDGCTHFLPGRVRGEGLTVAVIRKEGEYTPKKEKPSKVKRDKPVADSCRHWVKSPDDYSWSIDGDSVIAVPARWAALVSALVSRLDVIYRGIEVASVKGRDYVPSQALAMSCDLDRDAFPCVEVGYRDAIAFLRREAVSVSDVPKGYVLLTYGGRPLGFVKNLGNRANNIYPSEWRILSAHVPESPSSPLTTI